MIPDFSKKTIDVLARRAAFKCSNPNCRVNTVGPNTDPQKATTLGEAAHIYGARSGSCRFQPKMNDVARAEITNAIWLCRNCHKLIDADSKRFTPHSLFLWREAHESYVLEELGTTSDKLHYETQIGRLADFERYPPIIRRILVDKPDGWEWRLTAELMRYLNKPHFRRLVDLRDGLYVAQQQHIDGQDVVTWVQAKMTEFSNLIGPISSLMERMSASWGKPGEEGDIDEIHHVCQLISNSLEQVVFFEESIYFTNAPEEYRKVIDLLKDILGSQARKLADIPDYLDGVVELVAAEAGRSDGPPRTITKTIDFNLPKGWSRRMTREIRHAERRYSGKSDFGAWFLVILVLVLFWLIL